MYALHFSLRSLHLCGEHATCLDACGIGPGGFNQVSQRGIASFIEGAHFNVAQALTFAYEHLVRIGEAGTEHEAEAHVLFHGADVDDGMVR